jgi:Fanconi anemia group M protein
MKENINLEMLVYADQREKGDIIKALERRGLKIETKQIAVADYVLSDIHAIERKTASDFISSILDKRLFKQMEQLKENYEKPLLIIEGDFRELYDPERKIHPNAVKGALLSIMLKYNIPVFFSQGYEDTSQVIYILKKRILEKREAVFSLRVKRKEMSLAEKQLFLVEGLSNIGPQLSRALLSKFKTIKNLANANIKKLQKVEKIGEKKAKEIYSIFNEEFKEEKVKGQD